MNKQQFQKIKTTLIYVVVGMILLTLSNCKKYLDVKPDKKIATPHLLSDLDGMLNYYNSINGKYPSAGEVLADNYTLTDASWASCNELNRNYYTWQKYDATNADYAGSYTNILTANVILETLPKLIITKAEEQKANEIKGSALFIRAYYHFALAQLFAPVYNEPTASKDLGIVLKVNSDFDQKSKRATVKENYTSIIEDLKNALPLLNEQPNIKYRPSKAAAFGALAKTYLAMQKYNEAAIYADSCLQLYPRLMDYNTITPVATNPFNAFNEEVIYDNRSAAPTALSQTRAKVDKELFQSYEANDLRKVLFFKTNTDGTGVFKGNYTGLNTAVMFTGIASDEIYLIRAECIARAGETTKALALLRTLMLTRWKKNTLAEYPAMNVVQTIDLILKERRKELLFRSIRWSDLRRLNQESSLAKTLTRTLNGQSYELAPGSIRYTLQIDQQAIILSGMPQNP